MAKVKLSKKQKEVVLAIRAGAVLTRYFGVWTQNFELNRKKANERTIEKLKELKLVEFDYMVNPGTTTHYYKLTELGKTIEL